MKKCPYCAEEIQDEAIKCRYCHSDLTVPPAGAVAPGGSTDPSMSPAAQPATDPASPSETASTQPTPWGAATSPAGAPATPADGSSPAPGGVGTAQRYTHSGYRYVLGYGADFFGIWDRQQPAAPTERFARDDDGWRQAWARFVALEPNHVAVPDAATTSTMTSPAGPAAAATGVGAPQTEPEAGDVAVVQYTHTGTRYLLGYGRTFFGIWDRESPASPVERFSRSDDGWAQAWRRYTQIENNFTEVH